MPALPALCALLTLAAPPAPFSPFAPAVETRFAQVAPVARDAGACVRSPGQGRAVVLLHGLLIRPFNKEVLARPGFVDWQRPGSPLVRQLARDADVFAFAYTQRAAAEEVAEAPDLASDVARVRALGYREVVLVGYSAGGVIARQFVEDRPDAGVTKVVQVCAPNAGSGWAQWQVLFPRQVDFLRSLTKETRRRELGARAGKPIPPHVQFVCVVGVGAGVGDGLVLARSQWTEELRRQGVPAFAVNVTHWHALRSRRGIELVTGLVREPQPRWGPAEVDAARRQMLGR